MPEGLAPPPCSRGAARLTPRPHTKDQKASANVLPLASQTLRDTRVSAVLVLPRADQIRREPGSIPDWRVCLRLTELGRRVIGLGRQ